VKKCSQCCWLTSVVESKLWHVHGPSFIWCSAQTRSHRRNHLLVYQDGGNQEKSKYIWKGACAAFRDISGRGRYERAGPASLCSTAGATVPYLIFVYIPAILSLWAHYLFFLLHNLIDHHHTYRRDSRAPSLPACTPRSPQIIFRDLTRLVAFLFRLYLPKSYLSFVLDLLVCLNFLYSLICALSFIFDQLSCDLRPLIQDYFIRRERFYAKLRAQEQETTTHTSAR
jgi:hypothetical protein